MRDRIAPTRRGILRAGVAVGTAALGGCSSLSSGGGTETADEGGDEARPDLSEFRGSSPLVEDRPEPGGTSIADLPDLSGTLTLYIGGGEGGLYQQLASLLEEYYSDLTVDVRFTATNQILTEGNNGQVRADVFWANDAGSLGVVDDAGLAADVPSGTRTLVPDQFHTKTWVGVAGRARAVPYDTEQFSKGDVPTDIFAFTDVANLDAKMGWAPTYPAFQAFVTAMRILRGKRKTKAWLNGMQNRGDGGMEQYKNEWYVSNAVADGDVGAGIANHYYTMRVISSRSDAPIDLAFTSGDAGALVDVAGVEVMKDADDPEFARNFVRHLLSAEAQEFLTTRSFAYPMIDGVKPVDPLPPLDELDPPEMDLTKLADVQPTIDLLRETGVLD
ncbi:MAG: substrate-binding domain-containing protein [Haloferacaceae archaeon]